jgi:hypothetical protein
MISIIFHAFAFIHKRIDCLLGNPDTIFNIQGRIGLVKPDV